MLKGVNTQGNMVITGQHPMEMFVVRPISGNTN